jgi:hypothetical protein
MVAMLVSAALRTFVIALAVASWGCGPRNSTDVTKRSPAMVLIEPADEIHYYDNYDERGRPELEGISYLVTATYPAGGVICEITQHLAKHGWRPLQRLHNDVATPSSYVDGWHVRSSGTGGSEHIDGWDAEWVNDQGDLLGYTLGYRYPVGSVDRTRMRISGIRTPAAYVTSRDLAATAKGGEVPAGEPPHYAPGDPVECTPD